LLGRTYFLPAPFELCDQKFSQLATLIASPHITIEGGEGQDKDGQHDTNSWLILCSQPNLYTAEHGFRNQHKFYEIILWLGNSYTTLFLIYGDTVSC
jgi:hypothetical protein